MNSRGNLAAAYRDAGRVAEAISLFEQTLAGRERALGSGHPDTQTSLKNLAHAYQDAGRVAEAIPLFEQTLAGRERALGSGHPDPDRAEEHSRPPSRSRAGPLSNSARRSRPPAAREE